MLEINKPPEGLNREFTVYADLPGFACPTSITRLLKRPDLIFVHRKENVIVTELTCGFMTKIEENSERKQISYHETLQDLNTRYTNVTFINLSMSALGLIGKNDFGKSIFTALISIGKPK